MSTTSSHEPTRATPGEALRRTRVRLALSAAISANGASSRSSEPDTVPISSHGMPAPGGSFAATSWSRFTGGNSTGSSGGSGG